jgi:hypothetical protein
MTAVAADNIPQSVRPYLALGFQKKASSGREWRGICPFCGRDKFYVNVENGLWSCKAGACAREGNLTGYMKAYWQMLREDVSGSGPDGTGGRVQPWKSLSQDRGIPSEWLQTQELCWDGAKWLSPVRNATGGIISFRTWTRGQKERALPGVPVGLWGLSEGGLAALGRAGERMSRNGVGNSRRLWLCEGMWDAIALRYILGRGRNTEGSGSRGSENGSGTGGGGLGEAPGGDLVWAVPGASTWKGGWIGLVRDAWADEVVLAYDHDEAGRLGVGRVCRAVEESNSEFLAGRLSPSGRSPRGAFEVWAGWVNWPRAFPDGYDCRDFLGDNGSDSVLEEIVEEVPRDIREGRLTTADRRARAARREQRLRGVLDEEEYEGSEDGAGEGGLEEGGDGESEGEGGLGEGGVGEHRNGHVSEHTSEASEREGVPSRRGVRGSRVVVSVTNQDGWQLMHRTLDILGERNKTILSAGGSAGGSGATLYQHELGLARVVTPQGGTEVGEEERIPRIEVYDKDRLYYLLTLTAKWVKQTRQGTFPTDPPEGLIRLLLAHRETERFPILRGVVSAPIYSRSGVLCATPGYNPNSMLYYHETGDLVGLGEELESERASEASTRDATNGARALIDDLLVDFRFADASSRAHAIAYLILPFVREMISGPTPLHVFEAPVAGTGKTLLARVLSSVFLGELPAVQSAPRDEDEWRKRLVSWLSKGGSHLILDNVSSLESEALMACLTSVRFEDRLLGASTMASLLVRCAWAATANNLSATAEQARRCVEIRLDSNMQDPSSRTDFEHMDIEEWVKENRRALVKAVLFLVENWLCEGCSPGARWSSRDAIDREGEHAEGLLGGYGGWCLVVGGVLRAAGIGGFLGNRTEWQEQADTGSNELDGFVTAWREEFGAGVAGAENAKDRCGKEVTAKELVQIARRYLNLGEFGSNEEARKLGTILSKSRDRVIGNAKIRLRVLHGRMKYWLESV